jgi:hypothetical protein
MSRSGLVGLVVVALGLVGLSGCGGSSSTTAPTTPSPGFIISNLRVTPITAHGVAFTVDFTNPNGTVSGGKCNGDTNLGTLSLPITGLLNGTVTTANSGTIQCQVQFNTSSGTPLSGSFSLTDVAGNLSNALSFSAVLP